jgi:16S rRNA (adenine1518-N6/adenine1519-N6)-dimethyltransferase
MPRRPKLGQHFLSSARYRERITQTLRLGPDDLVIEIGAGQGAMTELLAARARHLVAVELDAALAEALAKKFKNHPAVEIKQADILAADLAEICRGAGATQCYVFGNLPYYITSPILHHLLGFRSWIRGMALLMQREVAERVAARPGSRDYGYLSVAVQLFSRPRVLFSVPPGAFSPPPKVQSALVEFEMAARFPAWSREKESSFLDFAKLCFAQKRKSLVNNLAALAARSRVEDILAELQIPRKIRAEQLTLEQLAALHSALAAGTESQSL